MSSTDPILAILGSFGAGLITCASPCVYPLIPITLAIFSRSDHHHARPIIPALCYVLGMSLTYTVLGLLAASTGGLFGGLLSSLPGTIFIALFFTVLALWTLDLTSLPGIATLQSWGGRISGKGLHGITLAGAASGLVAAPCVGPALVGILGIAAVQGQATWGAVLLFAYSLGMGAPFVLLATSPSLLKRLPRSGNLAHRS